ncbi:hypothetical protein [Tenacibaculum sp. 190524A02b]|uniref:hypothetical protein n=1 Tax=Tenacibaculum vairaonense TaxID=3137860 RepID=UPI0032B23913
MRNLLKTLLFILIFTSCKTNKRSIAKEEYYFPTKVAFSKKEDFQCIDLKEFRSFHQLVDSIEKLNYKRKKGYLIVETETEKNNILLSTSYGRCRFPLLKFKNILSISKDSIKKDRSYSIKELKIILKKDILNYGKDNSFSESPEKLMVSLTCKINELNSLILRVIKVFNEIQEGSKKGLKLNLFINRRMEIYPPIPKKI